MDNKHSNQNKRTQPTKQELCLRELISRGKRGMFQLEALSSYGETCLNSTISTLANEHGLIVRRVPHYHKNQHGGKTRFTRYSLVHPASIVKAQSMIEHYKAERLKLIDGLR
ncbi:hypothetical protein KO525_18660 [Psychrosphaera sp. B3R10]|uniref:hypothetical protein n=1 Tax=unclassified Psychrosphaera TaxID=2641570 RepID=UPI001C09DD00|nr:MULTISPECIES: hypothetical protein [unclassified Psychrosphaera]MBU2883011.1 hypothetical protein [Psychrosphaera sp. I2R16]MBU2991408.1 hypothetical protein [Psychrosphaera sp. B3R10]